MYINPFAAGILATVLVEVVAFLGFIIFYSRKKK